MLSGIGSLLKLVDDFTGINIVVAVILLVQSSSYFFLDIDLFISGENFLNLILIQRESIHEKVFGVLFWWQLYCVITVDSKGGGGRWK